HGQPGVVARLVHDVIDPAPDAGRQPVRAAEHAEPGVASHQLRELRVDRPLQEAHEHRDLVDRTAPVFRRERVEREVAESDFASCLRRSSVGDGMARRTSLPSFTGVRPRSDAMIAFSIALSWLASQGWITMVRASGTEMDAI